MTNKDQIKVEITQDKLVDLLLHAATREDIAKFATEGKEENNKLRNELKTDINNISVATLKALESFEARNDRQFQDLKSSYDRQFHKIDQRYNSIVGLVIGTGVTVIFSMGGLIAKGFHWF